MSRARFELRLFPLSGVVLFPTLRVPLHVFEPRYRALTRDALAGDRRIGMTVVQPAHLSEMAGDPPLYRVGCEGLIEQSQELPDGRYHVVLSGTRRFRIRDEPPRPGARLYRVAEVEPLSDDDPPEERSQLPERRDEVTRLLLRMLELTAVDGGASLDSERLAELDDASFVNGLAQALELSASEKQSLLEADGVAARCGRLASLLEFQVAEAEAGPTPEGGVLH